MATDCCCLTGNFQINLEGCIISMNTSSKAQFMQLCDEDVITGPVIGTLSITAYASDQIYKGCPGGAGVSMPWLTKFDCDNDMLHYVFGGEGTSFTTGEDVATYATKNYSANISYFAINANAGAGPATFCSKVCREEGYGLRYIGDPISFDTAVEEDMVRDADSIVSDIGSSDGKVYLQSFNLDLTPGNIPTASYSFLFKVGTTTC